MKKVIKLLDFSSVYAIIRLEAHRQVGLRTVENRKTNKQDLFCAWQSDEAVR